MAATREDDTTKVKDVVTSDVSKKEKRFGQKAKQDDDGTKVPKDEEDAAKASGKNSGKAGGDEDAAKASGKTSGKAGDDDDAAKNLGKADGEAESDVDHQDDAFVSPEEPFKEARMKWEARVQAEAVREEQRRGKVGDARAHADGKAVGKAKAGVKSRTTTSQRIMPGQVAICGNDTRDASDD